MNLKMDSHIEEMFGATIATLAYVFAHYTGMKFELLQSHVAVQPFNLTDKCINVLFGVITAIIAYFAVYAIKKYITHESK